MLVMFKSRGFSSVNLNPLDIINQIRDLPITVFINMLLFIPIGSCISIKSKSMTRSVLIFLLVILSCEFSQYIFHLGILDIVDIILNLCGFILGYLIIDYYKSCGWYIESSGNLFSIRKANPSI
ncbi:hypothetical protein EJ419_03180 [Alloscardovia theropitheci]|uniref:VanZ-like domain-containing protein n=2 Tax=Alloscardovia theropitheci TaxID=2496842 RepID=A0A4R0QQA8_9BIFI|nr:hypothetical protein EJ419_03180 [Alloscardovia theropitheci]